MIQRRIHEALERALLGRHLPREARKLDTRRADVGDGLDTRRHDPATRLLDHVVDHHPDLVADEFACQAIVRHIGMALADRAPPIPLAKDSC